MKLVVCQRRPENLFMSQQAVEAIDKKRATEIVFEDLPSVVLKMAEETDEPFLVVSGQVLEGMSGEEFAGRMKYIDHRNLHFIFTLASAGGSRRVDGYIPYEDEHGGGYGLLAQILTLPEAEMTKQKILARFPAIER